MIFEKFSKVQKWTKNRRALSYGSRTFFRKKNQILKSYFAVLNNTGSDRILKAAKFKFSHIFSSSFQPHATLWIENFTLAGFLVSLVDSGQLSPIASWGGKVWPNKSCLLTCCLMSWAGFGSTTSEIMSKQRFSKSGPRILHDSGGWKIIQVRFG